MTTRRFVDVNSDYIPTDIVILKERIVDDIYVLIDKISKYEYFAVYMVANGSQVHIVEGENYIFEDPSSYVLKASSDKSLHEHLRLKAICYES
jgi:hypothetical protein